jgi:hypothetical protein
MMSSVKKPFHKFIVPMDDPVFKYEHNILFLKDRESRKKLMTEFRLCSAYLKKKNRLQMD